MHGGTGLPVVIRSIRPEEHAELGELTVRVYRQVLASELETYAAVVRDVDARLAAGCEVVVAVTGDASAGDAVVGGVTYVPGPGPYAQLIDEDEAEVRMLVVEPGLHGLGLGRSLMQACIDRAAGAGKGALTLGTMPAMAAAQVLYRRMGFERRPELDTQIPGGAPLWCYSLDLEERASTSSRVGTRRPT
ncbi:GNAT family N-acetyltransferase [soil metagenome]